MTPPRPVPARPLFLPVARPGSAPRDVFALHHAPPAHTPVAGALLYLPPWTEEMNKSRRMAALASRALAAAGWHVLQLDPTGTGDSAGDFADAGWAAWLEDVDAARRWLADTSGCEPWLWGLRLGALLASAAAAQRPAPGLLLWQPVTSGRNALQQFLRLKAGAAWVGPPAAGAPGSAGPPAAAAGAGETPLQQLQAGLAVEIAGYRLAPALALPLAAAAWQLPPAPARIVALEVSPRDDATPSPALQRALADAGDRATLAVVRGPGFWQAQEIEEAPGLVAATLDALAGRGAVVGSAAPSPVARPGALAPPAAPHSAAGERGVVFDCLGESLLGVLAVPAPGHARADGADLGVLIAVGGPQYRAGSHRQFTLLARRLAAAGWPSLRFDARGMGDSTGTFPGFEQLGPDLRAAADTLRQACPGVRRLVVWGLCDAASAALMNAAALPSLAGAVLLNPWVRHAETHAATEVRAWYAQRLADPAFWRKLLRGGVDLRAAARELPPKLATMLGARLRRMRLRTRPAPAASGVAAGAPPAWQAGQADHPDHRDHPDYRERMAAGLLARPLPLLLVLSGRDFVAAEFQAWDAAHPRLGAVWRRAGVQRLALPEADHTFSSAALRAQVEAATLDFLARVARTPPAPAGG